MLREERLLTVLVAPVISEKATRLADADGEAAKQFVFKVARDANKKDIKDAIELVFKVKVAAVNVLNVKGKTRRFRQIEGRRNHWKKAYITLVKGEDLNFMNDA